MELWKDVRGYEGIYQVSNLGNVKSLDREISFVRNGIDVTYIKTGKQLSLVVGNHGYVICSLCGKTYLVHRLVAQAFIPNDNNLPCINHKDENPLNNCVENLEWCTYKHNNEYGTHGNVLIKQGHKFSDATISKMRLAKLGTQHSLETRQRMSKAHTGKAVTDEFRDKMRMLMLGKHVGSKWINNGAVTKFVPNDELDYYLSHGWSLGRKLRR